MVFVNEQKQRKGLKRLWHAAGYSLQGLRAAWSEAAFRLEVVLAVLLLPCAFWLGRNWLETAVLLACLVLLLIVELLNSAIEATVDRIGAEWHQLAKRAKDMGSAATLLMVLLTAGIWLSALIQRLSSP